MAPSSEDHGDQDDRGDVCGDRRKFLRLSSFAPIVADSAGKPPLRVLVSGAAGQIGYALLPLLANGATFGDRPVFLHLLDITPSLEASGGVKMSWRTARTRGSQA